MRVFLACFWVIPSNFRPLGDSWVLLPLMWHSSHVTKSHLISVCGSAVETPSPTSPNHKSSPYLSFLFFFPSFLFLLFSFPISFLFLSFNYYSMFYVSKVGWIRIRFSSGQLCSICLVIHPWTLHVLLAHAWRFCQIWSFEYDDFFSLINVNVRF